VFGGLWHLLLVLRMWRAFDQQSVTFTVDLKLTFLRLTTTLAILAHLVACLLLVVDDDTESKYSELYRDAIFLLVGMRSAPTVESEIALSCALVFTGTVFTGWILSSMLLALDFAWSHDTKHRAQVASLQSAMKGLDLPSNLKTRILCYKAYCHMRRGVGTLGSVFEDLSLPLQMELRLSLYANLVTSVPFLMYACPEFIKRLTLALEDQVFLPSDFIIVAGETAREMYFLKSGTVSVFSAGRRHRLGIKIADLTSSSPKAFFGEVALICDARRMAHVRANTYVICTSLAKATFCSLLEDFPADAEAIKRVANERGADIVRKTSQDYSAVAAPSPLGGSGFHGTYKGLLRSQSHAGFTDNFVADVVAGGNGSPASHSSSRSSTSSKSDERPAELFAMNNFDSQSDTCGDERSSEVDNLENCVASEKELIIGA
jgi:hypothetical protein